MGEDLAGDDVPLIARETPVEEESLALSCEAAGLYHLGQGATAGR